MKRSADVRSIDALQDAKAAIVEFREMVGVALAEAHAEIQRTIWWLQSDQLTHWKHEIRRRQDEVNHAKSEIYRAKLAAMDQNASVLEQRKMLERAERRLQEAEHKVRAVQHWGRMLDRDFMLYRGQCESISRAVDSDLPKAIAQLERMMEQLDRYLKVRPEHIEAPAAPQRDAPPPREDPWSSAGRNDASDDAEPSGKE
jgi:chromosome segregation ATPase